MLHKASSPPTKPTTYCPVPVLILVYLKSSERGKKCFFSHGHAYDQLSFGLLAFYEGGDINKRHSCVHNSHSASYTNTQ